MANGKWTAVGYPRGTVDNIDHPVAVKELPWAEWSIISVQAEWPDVPSDRRLLDPGADFQHLVGQEKAIQYVGSSVVDRTTCLYQFRVIGFNRDFRKIRLTARATTAQADKTSVDALVDLSVKAKAEPAWPGGAPGTVLEDLPGRLEPLVISGSRATLQLRSNEMAYHAPSPDNAWQVVPSRVDLADGGKRWALVEERGRLRHSLDTGVRPDAEISSKSPDGATVVLDLSNLVANRTYSVRLQCNPELAGQRTREWTVYFTTKEDS